MVFVVSSGPGYYTYTICRARADADKDCSERCREEGRS